eukprot:1486287-Amphidinium_carterae.1
MACSGAQFSTAGSCLPGAKKKPRQSTTQHRRAPRLQRAQQPDAGLVGEPRRSELQRDRHESICVIPGRYQALMTDIEEILSAFSDSLKASHPSGLPMAGAFPCFRGLFRERSLAMVHDRNRLELPQDFFQYLCGLCWLFLQPDAPLVMRAG